MLKGNITKLEFVFGNGDSEILSYDYIDIFHLGKPMELEVELENRLFVTAQGYDEVNICFRWDTFVLDKEQQREFEDYYSFCKHIRDFDDVCKIIVYYDDDSQQNIFIPWSDISPYTNYFSSFDKQDLVLSIKYEDYKKDSESYEKYFKLED